MLGVLVGDIGGDAGGEGGGGGAVGGGVFGFGGGRVEARVRGWVPWRRMRGRGVRGAPGRSRLGVSCRPEVKDKLKVGGEESLSLYSAKALNARRHLRIFVQPR